jgi:hypothetical protein
LTSIPAPPGPETTGKEAAAAEDVDKVGKLFVVVITRLGDEMSVVAEFTSMKSVAPTNERS